MKTFLTKVAVYLATNKKARAAEYALLLSLVEAIRASFGHA